MEDFKFSDEDINEIIIKSSGDCFATIVMLDGKLFYTDKGKSTWRNEAHAKLSLRNHFEQDCRDVVKRALVEKHGYIRKTPSNNYFYSYYVNSEGKTIYFNGHEEYDKAFDIFLKSLIDSGRLEFRDI